MEHKLKLLSTRDGLTGVNNRLALEKRELLEETGLFVDELEFLKLYTGEITHYIYANGDEIYGIDLVYVCRLYHGELIPQPDEVKSLAFYDFDKLPEKMWIRNKQIIEDFKNGK